MIEKTIVRKDDKLHIQYQKDKNSEIKHTEVNLYSKSFKKAPEKVEVSVGLTVSPKAFESIRVDYRCEIHHEPGVEFRDMAFDVAKFHCMERLVDDIKDLNAGGVIKEHFLLS